MRKRLIFATGVAVGYVLGARAGREKFDRMVAQAHQLWESPTMQEAAGVVQAHAARLFDQGRQAVIDKIGGGRHTNGRHADATFPADQAGGGRQRGDPGAGDAPDLGDPGGTDRGSHGEPTRSARRGAFPSNTF